MDNPTAQMSSLGSGPGGWQTWGSMYGPAANPGDAHWNANDISTVDPSVWNNLGWQGPAAITNNADPAGMAPGFLEWLNSKGYQPGEMVAPGGVQRAYLDPTGNPLAGTERNYGYGDEHFRNAAILASLAGGGAAAGVFGGEAAAAGGMGTVGTIGAGSAPVAGLETMGTVAGTGTGMGTTAGMSAAWAPGEIAAGGAMAGAGAGAGAGVGAGSGLGTIGTIGAGSAPVAGLGTAGAVGAMTAPTIGSTGAAFGGGMGSLAGWGELLKGGLSLYQASQLSSMGKGSPSEAIANAQLAQLLQNPSSITSMPGYEAGLQAVQRTGAAQGYLGSGNMMIGLSKYGGDFYNKSVQQLSDIANSGRGINAQMQIAGTQLFGQSANTIAYGLAKLFGG